jgi:hypothetical protein
MSLRRLVAIAMLRPPVGIARRIRGHPALRELVAVGLRLNPPPGWPPVPEGFVPQPGWQPDPSWPPPPPGWRLWVPDDCVPADAVQPPAVQPPAVQPPAVQPSGWQQSGPTAPESADASTVTWLPPAGLPSGSAASAYPPYSYGYEKQQNPGTNGFAIASLVLGIFGLIIFSAILGIIFGIIALVRIRKVPQKGKGLAIAGLATSCAWLALLGALIGYNIANQPQRNSASGQISQKGVMSVYGLRTGDCFDNPNSTDVNTVTALPCTQPHNAQVFAEFTPRGGATYPGLTSLRNLARSGCNARIAKDVNRSQVTPTMSVRFIFPEEGSWFLGHHTISCLIVDSTSDLTSSLLSPAAGG